MADTAVGARIHITGIVQGVGFRPFVFGLAKKFTLQGWVRNTSAGVDIEIDGTEPSLNEFIDELWTKAPPLAHIDDVHVEMTSPFGFTGFEILHSQGVSNAYQPISPDVNICEDCLAELFDPKNRRHRYPFINCTNCGPRFTIIKDIPYDRPLTTMAPFQMCPECASEYYDPHNRRFHAQPIACHSCGPKVWLEINDVKANRSPLEAEPHSIQGNDAVLAARKLLAQGAILAIKGLGGFHLACDASNPMAVQELRRRKLRVDKAFAVMVPNLNIAEKHCMVGSAGRRVLESPERPIVIMERRTGSTIAREVAPGQNTLGILLPYTPLHHLLIEPEPGFPEALVMTSGNISEEPIVTENQIAHQHLSALADAFLFHNREIETRCDDSVVTIFQGSTYLLRRARGYSPTPIPLPWKFPAILAAGAELKNTFCITNNKHAFLSHHIGDLENYETLQSYENGIAHFQRIFRTNPTIIAYDKHPDYMATKYSLDRAERETLYPVPVQHHHAHMAACMLENAISPEMSVIGVIFDGTGYGVDGAIWGGEFLVGGYANFTRAYHLAYIPLPGGDLAIKQPWRTALSWLDEIGLEWSDAIPAVRYARGYCLKGKPFNLDALQQQIRSGVNAPPTSSMGRLFDAVASIVGLRHTANYEAQPAVELEAVVASYEFGVYPFEINQNVINPTPMIKNLIEDIKQGISVGIIAARFHNTIALIVHDLCRLIRDQQGINQVVLSGGVWQNKILLGRTYGVLKNDHFDIFLHQKVPANDGGIALGQAAVAWAKTSTAL